MVQDLQQSKHFDAVFDYEVVRGGGIVERDALPGVEKVRSHVHFFLFLSFFLQHLIQLSVMLVGVGASKSVPFFLYFQGRKLHFLRNFHYFSSQKVESVRLRAICESSHLAKLDDLGRSKIKAEKVEFSLWLLLIGHFFVIFA